MATTTPVPFRARPSPTQQKTNEATDVNTSDQRQKVLSQYEIKAKEFIEKFKATVNWSKHPTTQDQVELDKLIPDITELIEANGDLATWAKTQKAAFEKGPQAVTQYPDSRAVTQI